MKPWYYRAQEDKREKILKSIDVIGDESVVGKEVRHDAESEKATWPSLIGLEASQKEALRYCAAAEAAIKGLFSGPEADLLCALARSLATRTC